MRGAREWMWLAFLSALFFLLLAPSSSFVPIRTEIAAERRMYLALVPVVLAVAIGVEILRRRVAATNTERRSKFLLPVMAAIGVVYFASSYWTGHALASLLGDSGTMSFVIGLATQVVVGGVISAVAYFLRDRARTTLDRRRHRSRTRAHRGLAEVSSTPTRNACGKTPSRKQPANPRAYDNLAAAVIRKDSTRSDEAQRLLRQAIAMDSTYVTAWNNLAAIEIQLGHTAEARGLLEHALRINPDYIDATERLGALLAKSGDAPTAIANLERVVAVHPTEEALSNLAIAYMTAGRRDDAKAALRRLIALNPHRADALSYLAAMLSEEGHPDQAIGFIESAVQAGSATPASYALLSFTYAQLGRADEARARHRPPRLNPESTRRSSCNSVAR